MSSSKQMNTQNEVQLPCISLTDIYTLKHTMNSIINTKTKKRLQEIVKDIDVLPKTDFLARHYLLHFSDLAVLLHLCIRNLKVGQKIPEQSQQQDNDDNQEQLGQGNNTEEQMNNKNYNKQILEILRNKNKLTEEEQIDLINDVITTMNREKELEKTRKIYTPANQDLIAGGGAGGGNESDHVNDNNNKNNNNINQNNNDSSNNNDNNNHANDENKNSPNITINENKSSSAPMKRKGEPLGNGNNKKQKQNDNGSTHNDRQIKITKEEKEGEEEEENHEIQENQEEDEEEEVEEEDKEEDVEEGEEDDDYEYENDEVEDPEEENEEESSEEEEEEEEEKEDEEEDEQEDGEEEEEEGDDDEYEYESESENDDEDEDENDEDDDDEEEDESEEEGEEEEDDEEEGDNDAKEKTSTLIRRSIGIMKNVCTKAGLTFPIERVTNLWLALRKYLIMSSPEGPESADRRFHLSHEGFLHFHGRFKDITLPLNKVLASLTLSQTNLFKYVVERGKKDNRPARYTNDEKYLIKNLVRLANLRKSQIPCLKIRAFC